jgi:hypothetical protein
MKEAMGEEMGTKTEALAINVDSFSNYNYRVQVVKNSSYEHNQMLDRAERMEYANWRISIAQLAPCNFEELAKWVDESYDVDTSRFEQKQGGGQQAQMMQMMQQQQQGGGQGGGGNMPQPSQEFAPGKQLDLGAMIGG